MLRMHLMQNWFGYSDPAMEEALYETTLLRQFASLGLERIPDETTIPKSSQETAGTSNQYNPNMEQRGEERDNCISHSACL